MSSSEEVYEETRRLVATVRKRGLPEGYRLIEGTPAIEEYRTLRQLTGLSPKTTHQSELALKGSWYSAVIKDEADLVVGMGRIIADGGWYFHIVDMAVHPNHQRKGLGDAIMADLMSRIMEKAPPGPYANLIADSAGRKLYSKWGFVETSPRSAGMERRFDGPRTS